MILALGIQCASAKHGNFYFKLEKVIFFVVNDGYALTGPLLSPTRLTSIHAGMTIPTLSILVYVDPVLVGTGKPGGNPPVGGGPPGNPGFGFALPPSSP